MGFYQKNKGWIGKVVIALLILGLIVWFFKFGIVALLSFMFGMIVLMYIFLTNYYFIDMIMTFAGLKDGIKEKRQIAKNKKYKVKYKG